MNSINPEWIETGTTAVMVHLYGEELFASVAPTGRFDDQLATQREQVAVALAAAVPLIAGDREQRAAELHERLMDLVGDYAQATIQMTATATDLTAGSDLVAERTARQRAIRDEILRLSGELRDLARLA